MEYIINDGHVTRTYDVKIDVQKLEEIIIKLKEFCYHVVLKHVKVIANSENEAITKINSLDAEGIRIKKVVNMSTKYEDLRKITKCPYVFECEYLCKENSYLVYILEMLLKNYRSSLNFKNQNNRLIDLLLGYGNSDEMVPYEKRVRECKYKIYKSSSHDKLDLENELSNLLIEMNNNINLDFSLLAKLYKSAKECFDLEMVSETVHYKDRQDKAKVYNLGTNMPK